MAGLMPRAVRQIPASHHFFPVGPGRLAWQCYGQPGRIIERHPEKTTGAKPGAKRG